MLCQWYRDGKDIATGVATANLFLALDTQLGADVRSMERELRRKREVRRSKGPALNLWKSWKIAAVTIFQKWIQMISDNNILVGVNFVKLGMEPDLTDFSW